MEELLKLRDLLENHGREISQNDSIIYARTELVKRINAKSMGFIAPYANEFFSFYYFKAQVLGWSTLIGDDPEYYSTLSEYYNTIFPEDFKIKVKVKR